MGGLGDAAVIFTLLMVAVAGVLILAAHHADEAGRRKLAFTLLLSALACLASSVFGPGGALGIALIALLYAIFLGLPIAGVVLLVRRWRRRAS